MNFPKARMRVTYIHEGKRSEKGWLVLDIRGLDLDGVNTLVLSLDEVETLKETSQSTANPLEQLHRLLGQKGE